MSAAPAMISDMLVTVKSREVQRAMLAEMRGDRKEAAKHFLAAAHLELVLADDYAQAGQPDLALRSGISAASCFWLALFPFGLSLAHAHPYTCSCKQGTV